MSPLTPPEAAPLDEWLRPLPLRNAHVSLEPLTPEHAASLLRHADASTTEYLSRGGPAEHSLSGWAEYIRRLNALPLRVNWAVVLAGGEVAGRISYSTVQRADRWLEIGTMLTPPFQGGVSNPGAKLLLLERAFTVLGAGRVQFRVDARNLRSRAAMRRLGALEEGVLRRSQVLPDGSARDSVIYSLIEEEWPLVRAGLEARLEALSSGRPG